jgi:hypothetical protein
MAGLGDTGGRTGGAMESLSQASILLGTNLIGMATAAVDATRALLEMGRAGAVALDSAERFNDLETSGAVASLNELREAVNNTIDNTQLQQFAIAGERAGLTAQQLELLIDATRRANREDLSKVPQQLNAALKALQSGRVTSLASLGLAQDLTVRLREESISLGVSTAELTDETKRLVAIQAIEARLLSGDLGPAVDGVQDEFAQFDATVTNLQSSLEEFVAESLVSSGALDALQDAVRFAAKAFEDNKEELVELGESLLENLKRFEELRQLIAGPVDKSITKNIKLFTAMSKAMDAVGHQAEALGNLIKVAFLKPVALAAEGIAQLVELFNEAVVIGQDLGVISSSTAGSVSGLTSKVRGFADTVDADAREAVADFRSDIRSMNTATEEAGVLLFEASVGANELSVQLDNATLSAMSTVGILAELSGIQAKVLAGVVDVPIEPPRPTKERIRQTAKEDGAEWGRSFWQSTVESVAFEIETVGGLVGAVEANRELLLAESVQLGSDWGGVFAASGAKAISEFFAGEDVGFGRLEGGFLENFTGELKDDSEAFEDAAASIGEGIKTGLTGARQAVGLFIKDQKALAVFEGGFQLAEAAAAFAEGFTNPVQFVASAAHLAAAAKYFSAAGKGGGGSGRSAGGGGRGRNTAQRGTGRATPRETPREDPGRVVQLFVGAQKLGEVTIDAQNRVARSGTSSRLDSELIAQSPFISRF